MTTDEILNNLKEQILDIEEKSITIEDIDDRYVHVEELSKYPTRVEMTDTINDKIKTVMDMKDDKLRDYVSFNDIDNILNGKGYLTKHQSLEKYLTINDFKNRVADEVERSVANEFTTISKMYDDKIDNLKTSYILTLNERNYVSLDDMPYIVSELNKEFISKDDVDRIIDSRGYVDVLYVNERIDKLTSSSVSSSDVENVVDEIIKDRIPTRLSELRNDVGYITKHQSLVDYARRDEIVNFITVDEAKRMFVPVTEKIIPDDVVHIDDIKNLATKDELGILKSESVNKTEIKNYVSYDYLKDVQNKLKNDLNDYVTKDLLEETLSNLDNIPSNLVKSDDIKDVVRKKELTDTVDRLKSSITSVLNSYVEESEMNDKLSSLNKSVKTELDIVSEKIDSLSDNVDNVLGKDYVTVEDVKDFVTESYLKNTLLDYAKKSELSGYVKKEYVDDVESKIEQTLKNEYITKSDFEEGIKDFGSVPSGIVKFDDIKDFTTKDELNFVKTDILDKLNNSGYVTDNDIKSLKGDITKETEEKFVKISDKDAFMTDFESFQSDVVRKNELSDYVKYDELVSVRTEIEKNVKNTYAEKSELEITNKNLKDLVEESKEFLKSDALEPYVRKDHVSDFSVFEQHTDSKYVKNDVMKSMLDQLHYELSGRITTITKEYLKIEDIDDYIKFEIDVDSPVFGNYYTKEESLVKFLSKEDYRGIKEAATLNFEYNDYPDLFFSVMDNDDGVLLNDGFYVVEGKAYIVKRNRIVPVEDKYQVHWEIEED